MFIRKQRELLLRMPQFWLAVLCFVVLGRGLMGDFVMDDVPVIQENSKITEIKHIPDYFTGSVWANTELGDQINFTDGLLYRPLFLLALNLGYQIWGSSPLGFHLLNLLLHCINTILVFYLIAGLIPSKDNTAAWAGAAIFAVHPVHVESIAWMAGLTDPLVSLFLLSCFLLHRRYVVTGKVRFALLAMVCYVAGLLSKEVALLFPLLLVLQDCYHQRCRPLRYLPYLLLLVCYFVLRGAALGSGVDWGSYSLSRLPVLLEFTCRYIQLLILPWPLEYYYAKPASNVIATGLGAIGLLAATGYLFHDFRRYKYPLLIALVWIAVTLLPALSIALMEKQVFAIRVLYLPSVGAALLVAWWFQNTQLNFKMGYSLALLIVVFAIVSFLEVADWRDDATFFTAAAKTSPLAPEPYVGLAKVHARNSDISKAVELYTKASSLATKGADQLSFLELAAELAGRNGDTANSERLYKKILQHQPQRSSAWVGLGNNALAKGENQQALNYYTKAYRADPRNFVASYNLALVYRKLGNNSMAVQFEDKARRLQMKQ